VINPLPTHSC